MLSIALAMVLAPLRVTGEVENVDLAAAQAGTATRVGTLSDDWSAEVKAVDETSVYVELVAPDGRTEARQVRLEGSTPEARGRELASALSVIIEMHATVDKPPEPEPEPEPEPGPQPEDAGRDGWVALGGLLHTGPIAAPDLAAGVSLAGGGYLLREHIQPRVEVAWSRARKDALVVDAVHLTAGVAFGAPLVRGLLWLGGGVAGGAVGAFAREETKAVGWSAQVNAPLIAQARWRLLFAELHAGPQLTLPPLRFLGTDSSLRWGHVRFAAGLRIGLVFPRR